MTLTDELHRIAGALDAEAFEAQRRAAQARDLADRCANSGREFQRDRLTRDRLAAIALLVGGVSEGGYAQLTLFGEDAVEQLIDCGGERAVRPFAPQVGGEETHEIVSAKVEVGGVYVTAQFSRPRAETPPIGADTGGPAAVKGAA